MPLVNQTQKEPHSGRRRTQDHTHIYYKWRELFRRDKHQRPVDRCGAASLSESGNSGRPLSEWEVRDSAGALLDMTRTVKELGLTNGARLFLSLRVGAGG